MWPRRTSQRSSLHNYASWISSCCSRYELPCEQTGKSKIMHRSTMHILVVYIRLDRSNLNSSLAHFKIKLIFCTVDNFEKPCNHEETKFIIIIIINYFSRVSVFPIVRKRRSKERSKVSEQRGPDTGTSRAPLQREGSTYISTNLQRLSLQGGHAQIWESSHCPSSSRRSGNLKWYFTWHFLTESIFFKKKFLIFFNETFVTFHCKKTTLSI